ncbi:MAG TPA: hypothetical protein VIK33_13655 [Anaerolineae bacterium]
MTGWTKLMLILLFVVAALASLACSLAGDVEWPAALLTGATALM